MLQISSHHYACMFTQPHKAPVGYGRSVGFKLQHQHVAELRRADICELVLSYGTTYRDDAVVWAKIKHVDSRTSGRLLPAVVDRKFAISQHHPLPLTGGPTSPAQCTMHMPHNPAHSDKTLRCVRRPWFKSHCRWLSLSRQPLRYTALGTGYTPLLQCLRRLSLPPSTETRSTDQWHREATWHKMQTMTIYF